MRVNRVYHPEPLSVGAEVQLTETARHHLVTVLRGSVGTPCVLFCGDNYVYPAELIQATKKLARVKILDRQPDNRESPLRLHLAQGISRGDRMDFALQKSVELGVTEITPLFTEHCTVKLSGERLHKKHGQWERIVAGACEQSGRNWVPALHPPRHLADWLPETSHSPILVLDPEGQHTLADLPTQGQQLTLLIGPEGGLSPAELAAAQDAGAYGIRFGPRVLRTETAALAALTALQYRYGDLS